ncbi:TonB-dependent receptor domain-containing protein [Sphingomonas morindae]|uniref:TonB-dependent receptor n=1 Tax=Sphingomonas morindae TaxID=1541170 RepID=A0ABY4X4V8_9SPHN|nr:TonB-dependent receptor [Sphingomonas morindae]USI71920.1 TonB-dependent receptor [Sphingomonas morindae]
MPLSKRSHLLASAILVAASAPALAQNQPTITPNAEAPTPQGASDSGAIIVTGTLFRNPQLSNPSPVVQVTAENLDARGISTIQEGIQRIAANNGPALTNSFTANGAFASGASAVSLRGLTTNSTLVLIDGMRAAYYPLADDGTRNFVDLNTIPDDVVERIDVLQDGASATYGADAIAGVVNIITKKNFKGFSGRAEGGVSSRGDASQYRLSGTVGIGDLDDKGYNAYFSGFYYQQNPLYNKDRPYPYSSNNFSNVCYNGTCGTPGSSVANGLDRNGAYTGFNLTTPSTPFIVAPADAATGARVDGARYQQLAGCQGVPGYSLTADELAANPSAPTTVCPQDYTNEYGLIAPKIRRYGATARGTARYGDTGEVFAEFNFLQTNTEVTGYPATIYANAPAGFYFPRYSTRANIPFYGNNTVLQLPVYVCPANTVGACTAANGTLNPNNPFAAQGQTALIDGRLPNVTNRDYTRTRAYRGAIGAHGTLIGDWTYNVNATAMHEDLRRRSTGYVYIQHLLDVIKDGSYNFLNPSATPQSVLNYLAPDAIAVSTSDLDQVDANIAGKIIDLPGGPLQLAVGGAVRYEAVDSPSLNSDINGGTQRYFTLNGFATKGHRTVYSAYAELNAPLLKFLTANLSGRYDKYPHGIDNFSPKAGVIVTPIKNLALKGTFSRGFRIPSFGESSATFPTTGYVGATKNIYTDSFLSQYGCSLATYTSCPTYVTGATYGATSLSNPNLKPEKSRNFTGGVSYSPMRGITVSADYYNIRKTNVITTANNAPAILAYYSGEAIPAGYTVIADAPDVNHPNATPRIAFVQSGFINANTLKTSGIDLQLDANRTLSPNVGVYFSGQASYILKLETVFPDGSVERYDGTLGNFNLTAGSGTPKWKATATAGVRLWQKLDINGTMNYFDGYDLSAMDQGTGYKDCGLDDGSLPCRVKSYVTFDLNVQVKVTDKTTFYATVQNIADRLPPIDTITYGANGYNPVQGGEGIYGRYFKAGVRFGL